MRLVFGLDRRRCVSTTCRRACNSRRYSVTRQAPWRRTSSELYPNEGARYREATPGLWHACGIGSRCGGADDETTANPGAPIGRPASSTAAGPTPARPRTRANPMVVAMAGALIDGEEECKRFDIPVENQPSGPLARPITLGRRRPGARKRDRDTPPETGGSLGRGGRYPSRDWGESRTRWWIPLPRLGGVSDEVVDTPPETGGSLGRGGGHPSRDWGDTRAASSVGALRVGRLVVGGRMGDA